jgi:alkanesulfonate monooxygenase SsuD/methylene tetrahydromethanopterin reductase-like flavin-dependent oxidoreductase (luciferase family)
MKYGLDVATVNEYHDPRTLTTLASDAEEAGWDGFFIWDTLQYTKPAPVVDPWVALSAIAVKTSRVRLGAMVTPLPRRRPWKLARETVTLDHLSGGRLVFGAGLGWLREEYSAFGEDADSQIRGQKLDEALAILTGLWSGERFSHKGRHYQLEDVQMLPRPLQSPRIPVWVAGGWPHRRPFRRAARWDGVYPGTADGRPITPKDLEEILAYMGPYRPSPGPFDVVASGSTPSDGGRGSEIVAPFAEAGATWWLEAISFERGPLSEMRDRIRDGPPRIH